MSGLFDTFNVAKRGLNVQQSAINTTSHNIANADTVGYSRQRAVAETTKPFGGMSRFDTSSAGQVGTGAEITTIQRIRDSFIDYQVRSETGTSGYYTTTSKTLSQVEDVFGEPSDTGIQELISQFYSAFQEVSKSPDKSDVKTVAIQKASSLADAINYTYNQLEKACQDTQDVLKTNVTDVNSYLDQINELNKQIRGVSAVGQAPNDLMDKRDNLLDQLSSKFGIKIDKDNFETINLSSTEYPDSSLVNANPNDTDYSRLSYVKSTKANADGTVDVEYYPLGNENSATKTFKIAADTTATDQKEAANKLADSLMQNRILIGDKDGVVGTTTSTTDAKGTITTVTTPFTTPSPSDVNKAIFQTYKYDGNTNSVDNNHIKGEIASNQSVQAKIQGYMNNLDRLAAGLAYSVNAIQVGSLDTANPDLASSSLVFVTYDDINKKNKTTDDGITAKNIRINGDLVTDPTKLNCNTTSTSGEGDGARANAIANLNILKINLSESDGLDLSGMTRETFLNKVGISGFSDTNCLNLNAGTEGSTVDSYYKTIINNLAVANQEATRISSNQETILANLEDQKSAVSGVSLDEEMTNLIQFQHAYQANAKMISTIDELLDVVINGLKR
ncbi:flagellar hook-associated protein FlgK [Clostridium beijerinckii]|nr:flagellar hook-associated protein FlgK [Clostridium beijerinckii]